MIRTNIVVTKNQKGTIRKVAEVFSSKESENDSPKSLHNQYYSIDMASLDATKEIFMKLLRGLSKHYKT